jgi:methionine synthase II (cobalamin-independent)
MLTSVSIGKITFQANHNRKEKNEIQVQIRCDLNVFIHTYMIWWDWSREACFKRCKLHIP